ncbi:MAG: branched-chain amino acid ABC transporter permease [Rhizobiaceae bacterium]|nr:branched-chain amino acid ABC transporter permease [Rhizobiaceae bacterium]
MIFFLQLLVSGLAVGSVYGLVALGFVLIFKATDVFNFAQGDLLAVGAYLMFVALAVFNLPVALAIIATVVAAGILGAMLQRVVFKPLQGQPLLTVVMATIALSLIIQGALVIIFGSQDLSFPRTLPSSIVAIGALRLSMLDLIIMGCSVVCVSAFALFFRYTSLGLQMRATAEHPEAAALSGINSDRVFTVAFSIGTVTAALGGIFLGSLQVVSPTLSQIGLLAFPAVVVGGLTSIPGSVIGGLLIGVLQQLSAGYFDGAVASVVVYSGLLLVLLLRPQGLLGRPSVQRH